MSIIRTLLNNGFFVLLLVVAVTLYLAYSDDIKRDHGLLPEQAAEASSEPDHTAPETAQIVADTVIEQPAETTAETIETANKSEVTGEVEKTQPLVSAPSIETPAAERQVASTQKTAQPPAEVHEKTADVPSHKETSPEALPVTKTAAEEKPTAKSTAAAVEALPEAQKPAVQSALIDSTTQNHADVLKQFSSPQEAINAARSAFYKKDFETAEKIYFAMAFKTKKADVIGELANVLYANKKIDWAKQAWLESASQLVEENRIQDAMILSNRLAPVAPKTSQQIAQNIQRLIQHKNKVNQPKMPTIAEQKARMQAYQAQMKAYQKKMQQHYSQAVPNMPKTTPFAPSIAEQKAHAEAYRKQVEAYQAKMRAYHEAQRQKMIQSRQASQPMPRNYPYNQNMNSAP